MAGSENSNGRRDHVLVVPFMAQGHMIPLVAFAKLLEERSDFTITLVTTPLNVQNLHSALPSSTTIRLAELPFCSADHGLPPDTENTDSLPGDLILPFFQASETLKPSFDCLVSDIIKQDGQSALCIIADEFMSWTVATAERFGIFHTVFGSGGAYGTLIFNSVWTHLPHKWLDSDEIELVDVPNTRLHRTQLSFASRDSDGTDPWAVIFRRNILLGLRSQGMLLNTAEEVEKPWLEVLIKKTRQRIWPIGPLLPPFVFDPSSWKAQIRARRESGITVESCMEWLDQNPPGSVLFASFGSENTIHAASMMELAKGLEASGKAFIWVVRPPAGFNIKGDFRDEWLPEGFEERARAKKQGILVKKWAPQLEILSHRSTGGFLSHCGWNSTLESLSLGVPLIGWPLTADQFYNSKMLSEDLGVCFEMARGNSAEIKGEEVVSAVQLVMDGESEKGKEMKKRAVEIKEKISAAVKAEKGCEGSSIKALGEFVRTVQSSRNA